MLERFQTAKGTSSAYEREKKEKFCTSSTEKQERSVLEGLLLILYFFI